MEKCERRFYTNELAYVTKMAAMPIFGDKL